MGLNRVRLNDGNAVEDKRFSIVFANQWEPGQNRQYAFNCYQKHFGSADENLSNVDISAIDKNSIPDFNLLTAGFPCQDYSVARKTHSRIGIEGKKGVLWWQINDILITKHPA